MKLDHHLFMKILLYLFHVQCWILYLKKLLKLHLLLHLPTYQLSYAYHLPTLLSWLRKLTVFPMFLLMYKLYYLEITVMQLHKKIFFLHLITMWLILTSVLIFLLKIFTTSVLKKLEENKSNSDILFSTLQSYLGNLLYGENIQKHIYIYMMLNISKYRFMLRLHRYQHDCKSMKGKHCLSLQSKQVIHDTWLVNSNITVDRRNGRDIVTISKSHLYCFSSR